MAHTIGKGKSEDSDEEQGEAAQVMEDDEEDEPSKGGLQVMWHWIWMQKTTWRIKRLQKTAMMRTMVDLELGNGMLGTRLT